MLHLRTGKLLLRPFVPGDAPAFARYRSDPDVARYQSWTSPYSLAAAEELVTQMQGRHLVPPRPGEWNQVAIQLTDAQPGDTTLIGDCVFRVHPDDVGQAGIGFTSSKPLQHLGYATQAVRALLRALFDDMGLHRVTAACDVENRSSQRVLERVGMRREAHFVQNMFFKVAWRSEYAYAILRSEWSAGVTRPPPPFVGLAPSPTGRRFSGLPEFPNGHPLPSFADSGQP